MIRADGVIIVRKELVKEDDFTSSMDYVMVINLTLEAPTAESHRLLSQRMN